MFQDWAPIFCQSSTAHWSTVFTVVFFRYTMMIPTSPEYWHGKRFLFCFSLWFFITFKIEASKLNIKSLFLIGLLGVLSNILWPYFTFSPPQTNAPRRGHSPHSPVALSPFFLPSRFEIILLKWPAEQCPLPSFPWLDSAAPSQLVHSRPPQNVRTPPRSSSRRGPGGAPPLPSEAGGGSELPLSESGAAATITSVVSAPARVPPPSFPAPPNDIVESPAALALVCEGRKCVGAVKGYVLKRPRLGTYGRLECSWQRNKETVQSLNSRPLERGLPAKRKKATPRPRILFKKKIKS